MASSFTNGSDGLIRHRRSKTGCITCRIRRVKCDEAKPSCKRCTSTGRKCDGYAPSRPGVPQAEGILVLVGLDPTPGNCSNPSACVIRSRRSFQLFIQLLAPVLSGYGTVGFWNSVVLQASSVDESIKHLVIAASNLHWAASPDPQTDNVAFLAHYGRALQVLCRTDHADVVVILITCILLALCDELQSRSQSAQQHIQAGQRILAAQHGLALRAWEDSIALGEITSTFSRLSNPRPLTAELTNEQMPNLDLMLLES